MRDKVHITTALLVMVLGLAGCGGQSFPAVIPVSAAELADLQLVPYIDRLLGLRGIVPEGWVEAYPGVYPGVFISGPAEERPGTTLVQRLEAGLTLDEAKSGWLRREEEEAFPRQVGSRQTASGDWGLYRHETETFRGATVADIGLAETEDGVYMVELWTSIGEQEALHEAVFLPAVNALAALENPPSRYETYATWPVVASIEAVGDEAHETVDFTLDQCTRLRVYAIGEAGSDGVMADFGYVENATTGQIIWQMYAFETESAGYYRNRRTDRPLTLPAGEYRLHFQTNGAHSLQGWEQRPPGHRFWGIALFEEPPSESNGPACWRRAGRPEELGWSSTALSGLESELEHLQVAALLVVTEGQVVFEWGNTANNFKAHSMRKSLISGLYGIYVDEGVIDPSQTLAELGIEELTPLTEAEKQATVLELLQARSGVYIPAAGETPGMKSDRPQRGSHKHGTHWYYNNWDFNALGTIFDQQTGAESIYQAFAERIAGPVGMQDFFQDSLQYGYDYKISQHPYYGFRVSARDLARFGQLYLQVGRWEGSQIVPADWVEESTRAISKTGDSGTYSGYGYMWWVAAKNFGDIARGSYCASGLGGHTVEVLPHLDTVIVIRFNTDVPNFESQAGAPIDRLIQKILDARDA